MKMVQKFSKTSTLIIERDASNIDAITPPDMEMDISIVGVD